ncbi:MAG TPA: HYR domain-containing protein [Nitrososphaera sp.]|nr:HYR domain-containing protein [Nitrososphaera sp.]
MYSLFDNGRHRNIFSSFGVAAILVFSTMGQYAFGDNLQADALDSSTLSVTIDEGEMTGVEYWLVGNGSDGCNVDASHPATVTLNLPSGVSASQNPFSLTLCKVGSSNNGVTISFTGNAAGGPYDITVQTITGGKSGNNGYNTNSADGLDITVIPPPNTQPNLTVPSNASVEGNTAGGANIDYFALSGGLSASDNEEGDLTSEIECNPISGSFFALGGPHSVTCSIEDSDGASDSDTFELTIVDTTDPDITVPGNTAEEATDANGAVISFAVTAMDIVDADVDISCQDLDSNSIVETGDTFALGTTVVTCTATDDSGNDASNSFDVIVQDTTAPALTLPADITVEATGPVGATVSYITSASDSVDGDLPVDCTPASGSMFPLGSTDVNCSATDNASNSALGGFSIIVQDTTAPALSLPSDMTLEATGPDGAVGTYAASAYDLVEGSVEISCTPASGSTFALGSTMVNCEAHDITGNSASGSFSITVQDTTPPELTIPADITEEATGPTGAVTNFVASATDIVDGIASVDCSPASGSIFTLGVTMVNCSATDNAGNTATGSFTVTVQDTTAPTLTLPEGMTVEATGPTGAVATFTASALDIVDGSTSVYCSPVSGSTFGLGTTTVDCTSTDIAGNTASGSFLVTVQDTTAPTLNLPSDISTLAAGISGATVTYSATAADLVDGSVQVYCTPASGSTFSIGMTAVNCNAVDNAGNSASGSFTVSVHVQATGFYQPVDMNGYVNIVKAGSTVPLKFEVFGDKAVQGTEISDIGIVKTLKQKLTSCDPSAPTDEVETTATGGTLLRYDATAGQFVYNWKVPLQKGCYTVTMTLTDDSTVQALFRLK